MLYLTLPPLARLLLGRPVALVVVYAVLGSLFIPFLAGTLLVMNRRHAAESGMRTGALGTTLLLACLGLFGYLSYLELARRLWAD